MSVTTKEERDDVTPSWKRQKVEVDDIVSSSSSKAEVEVGRSLSPPAQPLDDNDDDDDDGGGGDGGLGDQPTLLCKSLAVAERATIDTEVVDLCSKIFELTRRLKNSSKLELGGVTSQVFASSKESNSVCEITSKPVQLSGSSSSSSSSSSSGGMGVQPPPHIITLACRQMRTPTLRHLRTETRKNILNEIAKRTQDSQTLRRESKLIHEEYIDKVVEKDPQQSKLLLEEFVGFSGVIGKHKKRLKELEAQFERGVTRNVGVERLGQKMNFTLSDDTHTQEKMRTKITFNGEAAVGRELYLCGGLYKDQIICFQDGSWQTKTVAVPEGMIIHRTCVLGDVVFAIGQESRIMSSKKKLPSESESDDDDDDEFDDTDESDDDSDHNNQVESYVCFTIVLTMDLACKERCWKRGVSLQETSNRSEINFVVMGDSMYVCGGKYTTKVSCFNPSRSTWEPLASMNDDHRRGAAAVVDDLLYIAGGIYTNEFECYDRKTNAWSHKKTTPFQAKGCVSVALDKHLYIIGGYKGGEVSSKMYRYSVELDTWKQMASSNQKRYDMVALLYNGEIHVFGGYGQAYDRKPLKTVEKYNLAADKWEMVPDMELPKPNADFGHMLLKGMNPL